ncbi:MAG: hypothetical protein P1V51_24360 [Deltaproteobacteria bacterium]|nr:hypothetical protein [Deltaproteobacteria bacterium]
MQGLSAYVRTSSAGLSSNLRLVGGRVLVETAILAATLMPLLFAWRLVDGHLARTLPVLPPTFQPGRLVAADLLLFVTSARFLWPVLGLAAAAALLAASLRWGQRAAEVGVLASHARGEDAPPRGFFESLAAHLDRSAVVGVLEVSALLAFWGWAGGILWAGASFWAGALEVSRGWGLVASAALAFGATLCLAVGVVVHTVFPLALVGSIAAGWRPLEAPARALSLLGRRPLLLLAIGGVILGVRIAVAFLVGSVVSFAMVLPPEVLLTSPGQVARGVQTLIGLFTGGVITVFSQGLITAFVLDDEALLPVPAKPAPPPPPPPAEPVLLAVPVPVSVTEDEEDEEPVFRAEPVVEEVAPDEDGGGDGNGDGDGGEPVYSAVPLAEAEAEAEAEVAGAETAEDQEPE